MPRPLRIQYSGARYHVMRRGDRREAIFYDDADRVEFLGTLGQACRKTGWQVHAYCLMNNNFHLVLETPQPNLANGMKWLLGTYTQRFNRRHRHSGRFFGGRYKEWGALARFQICSAVSMVRFDPLFFLRGSYPTSQLGAASFMAESGEDVAWDGAWESLWAREYLMEWVLA
jgi:REP element-mobilizing transposase RayT